MTPSSFIYFPERRLTATPKDIGLNYQEVPFWTASGRKLHGWFLPHAQAKATFLFFHGNAGNISHRLEKLKIFYDLGIETFIMDYSGYGKSEGSPSEKNLYKDGFATYTHATQQRQIDPARILLYGESLGSSVAIEVALQEQVAGIILEGAFTSLKELASKHMPFLSFLAANEYNNLEKIGRIKVPLLFIHPKNDEICPFEEALRLYEKAPLPKKSVWLERGGHNDAFCLDQEKYVQGLKEFVAATL